MKLRLGLIIGSIVSVIILTVLVGFPHYFDLYDLMPLWTFIYPLLQIGIVLLMELVRKACNRVGVSTMQFMLCTYLPSVALSVLSFVAIIISFAVEGEVSGWDNLGRALVIAASVLWIAVSAFMAFIALVVRLICFIIHKVKNKEATQ